MGKQAKPRDLADNEARAIVRNLRTSPQKLNEVASMIRGMNASKALATLSFSRRRIADDVKKALQSAIANAENNHSLDVDRLVVLQFPRSASVYDSRLNVSCFVGRKNTFSSFVPARYRNKCSPRLTSSSVGL